jgi:Holliday junction resolvase
MKNYNYGIRKEKEVAQDLRNKKASVIRSCASRGSADLTAKFKSGKKWKVQVKSSRSTTPPSPSRRDVGRLKQSATKSGATPVIAKVTPKRIEYFSARSGQRLSPSSQKKR